jgi:hypothetical protein
MMTIRPPPLGWSFKIKLSVRLSAKT